MGSDAGIEGCTKEGFGYVRFCFFVGLFFGEKGFVRKASVE